MAKSSSLDLREQVGQLMIIGYDGTEMSTRLRTMLNTLQPAGVILFRRNIQTALQTYNLLLESQKTIKLPGFLCVDLEGGTVDRLRDVIGPAPAVADVASTGDKKLFRKHGRVLGEESRALGFNTDFAPVLDLGFETSKKVLTTRPVSNDPKAVVTYSHHFLKGLCDARVLGCGKHFPGLGEANLDTHKELPSIDKSWKDLWSQDLFPYRKLSKEIPFVMVAHAAYPKATKTGRDKTPASISKFWIKDVLRKKIGYKGLVTADDLEMGGVQAALPIEQAAVESIRSGSDLMLICHYEEGIWKCFEALLAEAERNKDFAKQVGKAAKRIVEFKKKSRELKHKSSPPTKKKVEQLKKQLAQFSDQISKVATRTS